MTSVGLTLYPFGVSGPAELVRLAAELESLGADHFVMVEGGNEAMTVLAALATATRTATIGSGIANIYLRHPYEIAHAAANIQDLSGGRFVLGLGTAHQVTNIQQLGLDMSKPLARMRDYVTCVRAALNSGRKPYEVITERYQIRGARLAWAPEKTVPIILAALSDGMIRLAAKLADGVVLSLATLEQVRHVRRLLDTTAREAGRSPDDIRVFAVINASIKPDRASARDMARGTIASYGRLPFYERLLARSEISVASGTATDEIVDALAIAGPPAYAQERLAAYSEAGVDVPLLSVISAEPDVKQAYRSLAALAG